MLATRPVETPFTRLIPRAFSHFRAVFTFLFVLSQIYASHSTMRDTIYGLIPRAFSHFRALFTLLLVLSQIYASHSTGGDTIYETYTTCLLS